MKVLFLSQIVPYPPHGGVLQRGYNVLREISRLDDVYLLAFIHPDVLGSPSLVEESRKALSPYCMGIDFVDLWVKKSIPNKYFGLFLGMFSRDPFSVIAHRSAQFRNHMKSRLRTQHFDVVHYDTLALAQYSDCKKVLAAEVVTHHNIESLLMARRSERETNIAARLYTNSQAAKLRRYELGRCGLFDINIAVSGNDERALKEIVPGIRTAVVPNGVDIEYFNPNHEPDSPALIYTGGMNMFANRDAVIYFIREIWPLIKKSVPGVKFYAVGQDPCAEIIKSAQADQAIMVTGYVDDIRPYVGKSSVYVVPLRVGGGTRLKILDSMAMGKAIVSTSIGCEGIDVRDGVNILIADGPEEFARKTVTVLHNAHLRRTLGSNSRKLVEQNYTWKSIAARLHEAYELAVANRRGDL